MYHFKTTSFATKIYMDVPLVFTRLSWKFEFNPSRPTGY